jgi:hypothetical protein
LIVGDTLTWEFIKQDKKVRQLDTSDIENKNDSIAVEIKQVFYGFKQYINMYSHGSIERSKPRSRARTNAYISCQLKNHSHHSDLHSI